MKILVVEPCSFMRLGMLEILNEHKAIDLLDVECLADALIKAPLFKPDIIFANMTSHCHSTQFDSNINEFLKFRKNSKVYCYLDANYPDNQEPIMVAENFFITNKQKVIDVLNHVSRLVDASTSFRLCTQPYSIFSDQEMLVMNDWMAEMPNYRIARKLNISDRTVYVHKRHITQKIKVRNRLEFCFVYNLIKYLYWPLNPQAQRPMSRQTKSDLLSLTR